MTDTLSKERRSRLMSRICSTETKIEVEFRKKLWRFGFRYSKNSTKYFGKPDLALPKYKTVIFIDGCFWHGCEKHCRIPLSNVDYWYAKIRQNKNRDQEVVRFYKMHGWRMIRIWEHDLKNEKFIQRTIQKFIKSLCGS